MWTNLSISVWANKLRGKHTHPILFAFINLLAITLFHFRLEKDCDLPEALNLLLEEALFLNFGLGCLYIFDIYGQKSLSSLDFWSLCLENDTRFIQRYVTYHHFRSKGWVVKSGLKFGGDFCKNCSSFEEILCITPCFCYPLYVLFSVQ